MAGPSLWRWPAGHESRLTAAMSAGKKPSASPVANRRGLRCGCVRSVSRRLTSV